MDSLAFRQLPRTLLKNTELCWYIKSVRLKMKDGSEVGKFWAGHSISQRDESDVAAGGERAVYDERHCRYQRRGRYEKEVDERANAMLVNTPEGYEWLGKLIAAMNSSQAYANDDNLLERAVLGEDVLLTPCLLLAHNLERLWIRFPKMQCDTYNTSFLLNSLAHAAQEGGLEKLKVLHLDLYQADLEWPVRQVLPFFRLPNLTDLTLGYCGSNEVDVNYEDMIEECETGLACMNEFWIRPARNSTITRLSLLSPHFSGSIAAKMLLACRAITEFELVLPHDAPPLHGMFYEEVGTALVQHVDTLTHLSLGDQMAAVGGEFSESPGVFSMVPRLSSLTSLRASPYNLFGYDVPNWYAGHLSLTLSDALPDAIERLWLDIPCRIYSLDFTPHFTDLFRAQANGRFPRLKTIVVNLYQQTSLDFECATYYFKQLMEIRLDAFAYAPTLTFDISLRVDCSSHEIANDGLQQLHTLMQDLCLPPLPNYRRYDVHHPDGQRHYVEASTCAVLPRTHEQMQDDADHGYWKTSPFPI
ncbi:hypothetical protein ACET3X_009526 [Alternaria dauci]|uniref:F-box domain-containing protein n=1 Tax=Alternaria dauci TaxID=48095 RepID=A0ABR3U5U6_9PLEO